MEKVPEFRNDFRNDFFPEKRKFPERCSEIFGMFWNIVPEKSFQKFPEQLVPELN